MKIILGPAPCSVCKTLLYYTDRRVWVERFGIVHRCAARKAA